MHHLPFDVVLIIDLIHSTILFHIYFFSLHNICIPPSFSTTVPNYKTLECTRYPNPTSSYAPSLYFCMIWVLIKFYFILLSSSRTCVICTCHVKTIEYTIYDTRVRNSSRYFPMNLKKFLIIVI